MIKELRFPCVSISFPVRSILSSKKKWHTLQNGALLAQAEAEKYHVLITTDTNLRYQQNLAARKISVLVLQSTSWYKIEKKVAQIQAALHQLQQGQYIEITI